MQFGRRSTSQPSVAALLLVLPFVVVYAALFLYPSIQMLLLSFTDSQLTLPGSWIGIANYVKLIGDRKFATAVINTIYFVAMTVVPSTIIGLGLAILVNRLTGVLQAAVLAVFFLPYLLPVSTVATIWWWMMDVDFKGPLGALIKTDLGKPVVVWRVAALYLPAVALLTIWWTVGFNVLIFLAGLRALPQDLFDAAKLDGAGPWATFLFLLWPLMWPVTALVATIQLILQFKVFDQVFLLIANGRSDPTMVLVQYVYTVAFQRNQGGYAATVAVAFFAIVLVVSVLQFQVLRLRSAR